MHCAACAGTVEATVASLPGVESADVNFALRKVAVTYHPGVIDTETMARKVSDAGYGLVLPGPGAGAADQSGAAAEREIADARGRLITSLVLSSFVVILHQAHDLGASR